MKVTKQILKDLREQKAVAERNAQLALLEADQAQRELAAAIKARQDADKLKAARFERKQAELAVQRLDANDGRLWEEYGWGAEVCDHVGPHDDGECISRDHVDQLLVVKIPVAANQDEGLLYLGEDGMLYLDGGDKIYRVDLMAYNGPSEIRNIGRRLKMSWRD